MDHRGGKTGAGGAGVDADWSALALFALALSGGGPITLSFIFSFRVGLLALPVTPLIALALLAFFLLAARLIARMKKSPAEAGLQQRTLLLRSK